jgi:hypothetical protein
MNWIEYYWGSCKQYARKHCTYTLPGISPSRIAHAIQTNINLQGSVMFLKKRWNLLSHR